MEKHDLHHEFPQYHQKMHDLRLNNSQFRRLFDEYQTVNAEIYKIETGAEVAADSVLNELRMKRVHMKDEVLNILQH